MLDYCHLVSVGLLMEPIIEGCICMIIPRDTVTLPKCAPLWLSLVKGLHNIYCILHDYLTSHDIIRQALRPSASASLMYHMIIEIMIDITDHCSFGHVQLRLQLLV